MRRAVLAGVAFLAAAAAGCTGDGGGRADPGTDADGIAPGDAFGEGLVDVPDDPGLADAPTDPGIDPGAPPNVAILEPVRGLFEMACDADLPVRLRVASERPLAALRLQDRPVTPVTTGDVDASFRPVFGLNRIVAEVRDDLGRTGRDHRALMCGTYAPPSEAVAHAADLYLGESAVAAIAEYAAATFDGADLTALFAAKDPLYASSLVVARPGAVSHDPGTVVTLLPGWGQVATHFEVAGLSAHVSVELTGSPSRFYDVTVRADRVAMDGILLLSLDDAGALQASLADLVFDFTALTVDVSGVADDLLSAFPSYQDTLVDLLETYLADLAMTYVPGAVQAALSRLDDPIPVTVLDRPFTIRFRPSLVEPSPFGLHLALDVAIEGLQPDPAIASPGVLHTPGQEEWPTVDGVRLSLKDDLLNAVFHEAWRSGLLRLTVDQAFLDRQKSEVTLVAGFLGGVLDRLPRAVDPEAPIAVVLDGVFPPVASLDLPQAGGVRLGVGDLRLDVREAGPEGASLVSLVVTVRLDGGVSPTSSGGVRVDLNALSIDLDVVNDDGALSDAESFLEETTAGLLGTLGPAVAGLLGTIPLPSFGGFALAGLTVGTEKADGGVVVVQADLVAAPREGTP